MADRPGLVESYRLLPHGDYRSRPRRSQSIFGTWEGRRGGRRRDAPGMKTTGLTVMVAGAGALTSSLGFLSSLTGGFGMGAGPPAGGATSTAGAPGTA